MDDGDLRLLENRLETAERSLDDVLTRLDDLESNAGSGDSFDYTFVSSEDRSLDRGEPMPFDVAVLHTGNTDGEYEWKLCVYLPEDVNLVTLDGVVASDGEAGDRGWRILGAPSDIAGVWLVVTRDDGGPSWKVVTEQPSALGGGEFQIVVRLADTFTVDGGPSVKSSAVFRQLFHGVLVLGSGGEGGGGGSPGSDAVPKILGGAGYDANMDTWTFGDTDPETGKPTYPVFNPTRLYWQESAHTLWMFRRTCTHNEAGGLYSVSAEVPLDLFTAVPEMP